MITAFITLDAASLIRSVDIKGHAGYGKPGEDIVCAAVSALVRTAAAVLSGREHIETQVFAPQKGFFHLNIEYKREGEPYLSAIQDFLITGLKTIEEEYPECLRVISQA